MIAIVWQFDVRPSFASSFVDAYGPQGIWAELFDRSSGFEGTSLLPPDTGHRYFTIDRWRAESDFEAMRARFASEYERIDALTAGWTDSEERLGVFAGNRPIIAISGLPGSGKTTLAAAIGRSLDLPVFDKDDFLEQLFAGCSDPGASRRKLSRESDELMKKAVLTSNGAVVSSFWRTPGMAADSGTPAEWVGQLSSNVLQLHCECPPVIAATRFSDRRRHAAHGDSSKTLQEVVADLERLERLGPPMIGRRLDIDTTQPVDVEVLLSQVRAAVPAHPREESATPE